MLVPAEWSRADWLANPLHCQLRRFLRRRRPLDQHPADFLLQQVRNVSRRSSITVDDGRCGLLGQVEADFEGEGVGRLQIDYVAFVFISVNLLDNFFHEGLAVVDAETNIKTAPKMHKAICVFWQIVRIGEHNVPERTCDAIDHCLRGCIATEDENAVAVVIGTNKGDTNQLLVVGERGKKAEIHTGFLAAIFFGDLRQ